MSSARHRYKLLFLIDVGAQDEGGWKKPKFADHLRTAIGRSVVSIVRKHTHSGIEENTKALEIDWCFRLFHSTLQLSCSEMVGLIRRLDARVSSSTKAPWNLQHHNANLDTLDSFHLALHELLEHNTKKESNGFVEGHTPPFDGHESSPLKTQRGRGALARSFMDVLKDSEWSGLEFEDEESAVVNHNAVLLFADVPINLASFLRMFRTPSLTGEDGEESGGQNCLRDIVSETRGVFQRSVEKLALRSVWYDTSDGCSAMERDDEKTKAGMLACQQGAEQIMHVFRGSILPWMSVVLAPQLVPVDVFSNIFVEDFQKSGIMSKHQEGPEDASDVLLWSGRLITSVARSKYRTTKKRQIDVEIILLQREDAHVQSGWNEEFRRGKDILVSLGPDGNAHFKGRDIVGLGSKATRIRDGTKVKSSSRQERAKRRLREASLPKKIKDVLCVESFIEPTDAFLVKTTSGSRGIIARVPDHGAYSNALPELIRHLMSNNLYAFATVRNTEGNIMRMIILKPLTLFSAVVLEAPSYFDMIWTRSVHALNIKEYEETIVSETTQKSARTRSNSPRTTIYHAPNIQWLLPRKPFAMLGSGTDLSLDEPTSRLRQRVDHILEEFGVSQTLFPSSLLLHDHSATVSATANTGPAVTTNSKRTLDEVTLSDENRQYQCLPNIQEEALLNNQNDCSLDPPIAESHENVTATISLQDRLIEFSSIYNKALESELNAPLIFVSRIIPGVLGSLGAKFGDRNQLHPDIVEQLREHIETKMCLKIKELKVKHPPAPADADTRTKKIREYQMQVLLRLEIATLKPSKINIGKPRDPMSSYRHRDICALLQSISFLMDARTERGLGKFLDEVVVQTYKNLIPHSLREIYDELMIEQPKNLKAENSAHVDGGGKAPTKLIQLGPNKSKVTMQHASVPSKTAGGSVTALLPSSSTAGAQHGGRADGLEIPSSASAELKSANRSMPDSKKKRKSVRYDSLAAMVEQDRAGGLATEKRMKLNNFTHSLANASLLFRSVPNPKRNSASGGSKNSIRERISEHGVDKKRSRRQRTSPVGDPISNLHVHTHDRWNKRAIQEVPQSRGRGRREHVGQMKRNSALSVVEETPGKPSIGNARRVSRSVVEETPDKGTDRAHRPSVGGRNLF